MAPPSLSSTYGHCPFGSIGLPRLSGSALVSHRSPFAMDFCDSSFDSAFISVLGFTSVALYCGSALPSRTCDVALQNQSQESTLAPKPASSQSLVLASLHHSSSLDSSIGLRGHSAGSATMASSAFISTLALPVLCHGNMFPSCSPQTNSCLLCFCLFVWCEDPLCYVCLSFLSFKLNSMMLQTVLHFYNQGHTRDFVYKRK